MGFRIDGTFGGVAVWISWDEGRLEASDRVPLEFAKTQFRIAHEARQMVGPVGLTIDHDHILDPLATFIILTDRVFDPHGQSHSGDVPTVESRPDVVYC